MLYSLRYTAYTYIVSRVGELALGNRAVERRIATRRFLIFPGVKLTFNLPPSPKLFGHLDGLRLYASLNVITRFLSSAFYSFSSRIYIVLLFFLPREYFFFFRDFLPSLCEMVYCSLSATFITFNC